MEVKIFGVILHQFLGDDFNQFRLHPTISSTNTTLSRTNPLDREAASSHILTIEATNLLNPNYTSQRNVTILLGDLNDNAPVFVDDNIFVTISEHIELGSYVVTVNATDLDSDVNANIR